MDVKKFRSIMVLKGFNQLTLAVKAGMSPTTLSNKLNSKSEFTRDEMQSLSEVLETDVKELFFCEHE